MGEHGTGQALAVAAADDHMTGALGAGSAHVARATPESAAAPQELRSEQLARLATSTAAAAAAGMTGHAAAAQELEPAQLAAVLAAVDASTAEATKRAYRSDWRRFTLWADAGGFPPLPASPLLVAHYLTQAAAQQTTSGGFRYTPATLSRWVASINQVHAAAGLDRPGRSEVVRRALAGIRRIRATPPNRREPLLLTDIRTLLEHLTESAGQWPAGVAARRDAALLLMGFAGAFRRSELVALTSADVALHRADGLHVRIRRSKTDKLSDGQVKALPYGRDPVTCPPCAYLRWRELLHATDTADPGQRRRAVLRVLRRQATADAPATGIVTATEAAGGAEEQPHLYEAGLLHVCRSIRLPEPADAQRALFPTVHRTGAIGDRPLTGHAVNEIIRRRAADAGFTAAQLRALGGHSLRAGFVTQAYRAGADAHAIMRQTGHRTHAMLEIYAREHAPLVGNAVTTIGL